MLSCRKARLPELISILAHRRLASIHSTLAADGLIRFGDKLGHSGQQKVGPTEMGKTLEAASAVRPRLKHLTYYNMLEATYYDSLERCKDQRHKDWAFEVSVSDLLEENCCLLLVQTSMFHSGLGDILQR
jgi:hypothetical protein